MKNSVLIELSWIKQPKGRSARSKSELMGSTAFLINGKVELISHGELFSCYSCQKVFNWSHLFNCIVEPIPIEKVLCEKCRKPLKNKVLKSKPLPSKRISGTAKQRKITEFQTSTSRETGGIQKDINQGAWRTLQIKCCTKQTHN